MHAFFWQNTNSIHQSAFLKALSKKNEFTVTLIVTVKLAASRIEMGWQEPDLPGVNVVRAEEGEEWKTIINGHNGPEALHIFSGINAFPRVHQAFKYAIGKKCRIGILSEALNYTGSKGKLRTLKGMYNRLLYNRHISFLLAMGDLATEQYRSWGYSCQKIFTWAYTIEQKQQTDIEEQKDRNFTLMFAGALIHRKGLDLLISALQQISDLPFRADLYCIGKNNEEEARKLQAESKLNGKLNLLPFLPNEDVRKKMSTYDLFVLPSRFDGWGAVISESLMCGTPVLASHHCGASSLLKNQPMLGAVIRNYSAAGIATELRCLIGKGKTMPARRLAVTEWYNNHVSGEAMANYFSNIVAHLSSPKASNKPLAPWQKIYTK